MPRIFSATYTPYTYEELAAPVRDATVAHQAVEQNFDTLMTDADKMRAFLNEDWQSYKDYKEYVDQLNAAAYDLARNGLTRQNRGNLLQLKRDYNGKIQTINAGILSRQNEIDTFKKSAKGQSSRYIGPRPEDYSVDEYMYGNNPFKMGVDGSEIYSYADEQAKASTSRRYQEFTEGGKWRITEVGVDPNTTSMVMDALRTGKNFTDPEYALLAQNNPRQFQYMQAVLNDMRGIADSARETFGYGQFGQLNDNGDEKIIPTPNQLKFDTEIFGGLNKGIQYDRKSQADPYAKAAYDSALKEQEAQNDFQRELIKIGLQNGSLLYNPTTGQIRPANVDVNGASNGDINIDTPDVREHDFTVRNENVTKRINKVLGVKEGQVSITQNSEDGSSIITGFRDDNIKKLGIRDDNGNIIDNKVDLFVWAGLGANKKEAQRKINELEQKTKKQRHVGSNYAERSIGEYISTLSRKQNPTKEERQMINEYNQARAILDESQSRWRNIPIEYKITEREYDDLKEAMGYSKDKVFTMDDLENTYLYNKGYKSNYADVSYSILGNEVENSGGRKLSGLASKMLASFDFGDNENKIQEYEHLGNDTYGYAKKGKYSSKDEYLKDKGIMSSIYDIQVTKGMLMHLDNEGNIAPLMKVYYGNGKSKILPMSRLSNEIEAEFYPLAVQLVSTYGEFNPNNTYDETAINNIIRARIQQVIDKYK